MEIGNKEDIGSGSGPHGIDIQAVSRKGRGEDAAVDEELCGPVGVLGNLAADSRGISRAIPVEVERDEDFHIILGGRLVRVVELLVGIPIHADVEGKGINPCLLCPAHIIVVISRACAVTHYANLVQRVI